MTRARWPARWHALLGLGAGALALGTTGGCSPCDDDGQTAVCGDFGALAFQTAPELGTVQWPAAATERSSLLVSSDSALAEVSPDGDVSIVQSFSTSGASGAVSVGDDGRSFVARSGEVVALGSDSVRWTHSVGSDAAVGAPALGDGVVHVAVATGGGSGRDLVTLDADSGDVLTTRPGAAAGVVADDGLTYLTGPRDCGASFDGIVNEDAAGAVRWRHQEPSGIRDFAPGPDGEIYVVTGDRELVRLSSAGEREWTFVPDCSDCTVAGAPTVTDDAIYFPVWQGEPPNRGCDDPDPTSTEPDPVDAVDPLYALRPDGSTLWSYDGFSTLADRQGSGGAAGGMLGLAMATKVHHHPGGRPVVADDGTLFVPADGAIVALDPNGKELGFALYDSTQGETRSGDGGVAFNSTWNNGGTARAPVLTNDGNLHVWDGWQLRAFRTGKKPASIPWSAPFGGNRNAGRIGG